MAELEQMHALSEPTYCRLKHSKNPTLLAKLPDLQNVLAVLKSCQKQQDKIMSEAKVLQIMIYKRRLQLRSEKSLQLVRRVQACLKRANTFGRLFSLTDDSLKDLLSAVAEMKTNDVVYLPAQQTWSYLLYLQLQYLKLLDINCSYCIAAFNHLSCQFAAGMLIPQMVVFMGIMARIWLLSRSIAEKIQGCYGRVYSLREHFSRTNSAWKEPVLPPHLQRSNPEDDCRDVQEMYSLATSNVPVHDSVEIVETANQLLKVFKNTVSQYDEEMEDIGVPIVLTETNHPDSSDNRSHKRKQTEENDFTPHKKRKQMNDSSTKNGVSEVSDICSFSSLPSVKRKKKKKKHLETVSSMEVKHKRNSNVQKGSVKGSLPEENNNVESSHYVSGVPNISSYSSFSAQMPAVGKKKKKKHLEKVSNTEAKQKKSSNLQKGSAAKEDHDAESTHTHETRLYGVLIGKQKKKKHLEKVSSAEEKQKKSSNLQNGSAAKEDHDAESTNPNETRLYGALIRKQKKKKKHLEKVSNTEEKQKKSSNLQNGSAAKEDHDAEGTHTHETKLYGVLIRKQKKKKIRAVSF